MRRFARPFASHVTRLPYVILLLFLGAAWAQAQTLPQGTYGSYTTLEQTLNLAGYSVQLWTGEPVARPQLVRILSPAGTIVDFEDFRIDLGQGAGRAGDVTVRPGDDINGNGVPDLVLEGYSGGAHCCFSYRIYELGDEPRLLFAADTADAGLAFEDLDGDGVPELLTYDAGFAYAFCSFADSPFPPVILSYRGDQGYLVANERYPAAFDTEIAASLARMVETTAVGDGAEVQTCAVLALVLDLLYAGRERTAWQALELFLAEGEPAAVRRELEALLERSRWYLALSGR